MEAIAEVEEVNFFLVLWGDAVDKNVVREAILTGNAYVDLKPFSGQSPF
jgi:hypothetical protein